MAGRGPAPKDPAKRRRRNATDPGEGHRQRRRTPSERERSRPGARTVTCGTRSPNRSGELDGTRCQ